MPFAIVTGGTRGIGKAIIELLSKKKFDIVTCSRDEEDLKILKKEIEHRYKNTIFIFPADLSKKSASQNFVNYIKSLQKPIDVLINNTGIFLQDTFLNDNDQYEKDPLPFLMDVNLFSAYYITKGLIKNMFDNRKGHIFNICSIASLKAYPNSFSYTITKSALIGFSRSLRLELEKHNIRVTSIIPGATYTSSWGNIKLPKDRFIKATDIAKIILNIFELSQYTNVDEIVIRPIQGDI